MTYLIQLSNKPYPYLFSTKRNTIIAIVLGLLVYIVNTTTLTENHIIENYVLSKTWACVLAGLVTFGSIILVTEMIPRLFFKPELKENWTVGKESLLILFLLFVIAISNNFLSFIISQTQNTVDILPSFLNASFYVIIIGTTPTILIIWINYTLLLRENLKQISFYNKELETKVKAIQNTTPDLIEIPTHNKNEILQLNLDSFLFAKTEGNYIDVFIKNADKIEYKAYRLTLQKLEEALKAYPFISKTHRSYIVNVKNISSTSGNARNYRIHFEGTTHEVPVSRNKFQTFKEAFGSNA
ncbi:LytTR family DNA-binding domain-containing protein [Aureispira sp. CCB-QB1]|uniref:LytR/AlgR family response regulator transcription factor n=1 Tax=Aureispira sp. CCB-QB1 TaxID=1313421 RepID=UPI00069819CB|nr:LytTR family DNA-binding domain-containing protein [Aureispira sp. CCB-QB1]